MLLLAVPSQFRSASVLKRHPDRLRQEADRTRRRYARLCAKRWRKSGRMASASSNVVPAMKSLRFRSSIKRVGGVEAARRALQGLPPQREGVAEGVGLGDAGPGGGVVGNGGADGGQGLAARVPDAAGGETRVRLQVQVEAGGMRVFAGGVAKVRSRRWSCTASCPGRSGCRGRFGKREPPLAARVGDEMRADVGRAVRRRRR